jgi:hypothetical protein
MGRLRTALAIAVLRDVRPDLVIFDEFQKFREMLIDPPNASPRAADKQSRNETDPVTLALRGGSSKGHGVLLLSATPYRLYTTRQEEAAGASHHQDFLELIRFLFGPASKQPREIERAFRDFGGMMLAKETPDFKVLGNLRLHQLAADGEDFLLESGALLHPLYAHHQPLAGQRVHLRSRHTPARRPRHR